MKILEIKPHMIFEPKDLDYRFLSVDDAQKELNKNPDINAIVNPLIFTDEETLNFYKGFMCYDEISLTLEVLPDDMSERNKEVLRRRFYNHFRHLKEVTAYDFPKYYDACKKAFDEWEGYIV